MPVTLHDERRSFLFFLLFLIFTAFLEAFAFSSGLLGVLCILWGGFGFLRFIHLNHKQFQNISDILNLPSRILFGLGRKQEEKIRVILKRLGQPDVMFWFWGSVFFVVWIMFCSFHPTEISVIQELRVKQEAVLESPLRERFASYAVMTALSSYGILGIIILIALSYSQSRTNINWAFYILWPVFISGVVFSFLFSASASFVLWPDISVLRGGGLGQADVLLSVSPDMMMHSGTGLMRRFAEGGVVGALVIYAVFFPAFLMMIKAVFDGKRQFLKPVMGLLSLILLLILDIFWISAPLIQGLTIMGLALIALCWGAVGRQI